MFVNTFHYAMSRRFGKKMYRLSLDCGFTCPNRDGSKGVGGCAFCSSAGAGNFAGKGVDLDQRLQQAQEKIAAKAGHACGYIAYFQSHTNTYAPLPVLENLFTEAIDNEKIEALSIATRPDCLPPEVLDLLESLNRRKPVWVELGLQTANDHTAKKLNRCYPTSEYDRAVSDLHARGLEVITHLILGLPGETLADMEKSVRHAVSLGSEGMKLHLLHILRHTELEKMYLAGLYRPFEREEYIDLICRLLPLIPRETVIHRMTGDGDKKELIAPLWSADKKKVLNALNKELERRDIVQGCAYDT